jgi:hypothetical protein
MGITISTPLTGSDYNNNGTLFDLNNTSAIRSNPIFTDLIEVPLYNSDSDSYFPTITMNELINSYITPYYTVQNTLVNMTYIVIRFYVVDKYATSSPIAIRLSAGLASPENQRE